MALNAGQVCAYLMLDTSGFEKGANSAKSMMLRNKLMIAVNEENGYHSIWVTGARCYDACKAMDGTRVTTLTPPLHKGCECSVTIGPRILSDAELAAMGSDEELYADAAFMDGASHFQHMAKHKNEMAPNTSKAYLSRARKLLQEDENDDILVHRNGEYVAKFDKRTGLLATGEKGTIITSFVPKDGVKYFYDYYGT